MTKQTLKANPRRVLLWGVSALMLALAAASTPGAAQASIYGLWRDQSGGLWCGGPCRDGQSCCTITPVQPAPAP
jgi:hypothetical protein